MASQNREHRPISDVYKHLDALRDDFTHAIEEIKNRHQSHSQEEPEEPQEQYREEESDGLTYEVRLTLIEKQLADIEQSLNSDNQQDALNRVSIEVSEAMSKLRYDLDGTVSDMNHNRDALYEHITQIEEGFQMRFDNILEIIKDINRPHSSINEDIIKEMNARYRVLEQVNDSALESEQRINDLTDKVKDLTNEVKELKEVIRKLSDKMALVTTSAAVLNEWNALDQIEPSSNISPPSPPPLPPM